MKLLIYRLVQIETFDRLTESFSFLFIFLVEKVEDNVSLSIFFSEHISVFCLQGAVNTLMVNEHQPLYVSIYDTILIAPLNYYFRGVCK